MTRVHDTSLSWCRELQSFILQARQTIHTWGDPNTDSDFPVDSAACFPWIVRICVCTHSVADGNDSDSDGDINDGVGDGVGAGDCITSSSKRCRLTMSTSASKLPQS